ncbi:MAG: hypothetical protein AAGA42_08720, partial [Actinomycetota bacterium]
LTSSLPAPHVIARDFGPLVAEQRLLGWMSRPEEQNLIERTGMAGALPELGDGGGFGVSVTNGGNSKIDYFLERDVEVVLDTGAGSSAREPRLVAEVVLTNTAPSDGVPDYVIGNAFGLPRGTSRSLVSFYGPPGLVLAERDGVPIDLQEFAEAGWSGYRDYFVFGPGESSTFRLEFSLGPAALAADEPHVYLQPLARP